ncbi:MAG: hypothetical protein AB1611_20625 [bacterium]
MENILPSFFSAAEADQGSGSPSKSFWLLPVFCCLSAEAGSYLVCNLSLEIARRNRSVSVIDFCLEQSNVRYLMGNLVDLNNDFPRQEKIYRPDLTIESVKLFGFSRVTIVTLAIPGEQAGPRQIIRRIFADQRVGESDIILINLPNGPDDLPRTDPFTDFHRAIFFLDSRPDSLLRTYSWIKKSLSFRTKCLIGAVSRPDEKAGLSRRTADNLERVISKYLPIDPQILMPEIPFDQEARSSIKSRSPLVLLGSSSVSSQALSELSENLLGIP